MSALISELFAFLFRQPPSVIWRRVRERDVPWIVQLALYGFCGVMATAIEVPQVVILSKTIIPAYEDMIVNGQIITDALRAKNLLINNTIAFFTTNILIYLLNVTLVFKRGRHHPWLEFLYFSLINGLGFTLSQIAGPGLIHQFGITTNVAIIMKLVFSILVNFMARKFFIFKG